MAQQKRSDMQAREVPLVFGEHRIGSWWIWIGVAAFAFAVVAVPQLAAGTPKPLLVVGPILTLFTTWCATTRVVEIDLEAGEVVVTRRLLGLTFRRRLSVDRFRRVVVTMEVRKSRHAHGDGTLAGEQRFMHYPVTLRGRGKVPLDTFDNPVAPAQRREGAERLARTLALRMGLLAERRGYTVEDTGRAGLLTVRRRRAVEPLDLELDPAATARSGSVDADTRPD